MQYFCNYIYFLILIEVMKIIPKLYNSIIALKGKVSFKPITQLSLATNLETKFEILLYIW